MKHMDDHITLGKSSSVRLTLVYEGFEPTNLGAVTQPMFITTNSS